MSGLESNEWARLVRALLARRHRSELSLERQLGWQPGSLARLFGNGPPSLRRDHLRQILEALGAAPVEPRQPVAAPPSLDRRPRERPEMDLEGLQDLVRRVVRAELARHEGGVGALPGAEDEGEGRDEDGEDGT